MPQGPRFDYISILIGNSADLAQQFAHTVVREWIAQQNLYERHPHGSWSVKPEYNTALGHSQYFLRIWGEMANEFIEQNAHAIRGHLITRADVRYELPNAKTEALRAFGRAAASGQKGRRNVQLFDSKGRNKTGSGRSTGGVGLAIGSHKSDRRVSAYQRAGAPVAVEISLQGRAVADLWSKFCGYDEAEQPWLDQLRDFMDQATYTADEWLAQAAGIDTAQLMDALHAQDGNYFGFNALLSADSLVEMYEQLEPSAKRDVRARLAQMG